MFSNIEVENTAMEIQELHDINPSSQIQNVNMNIKPQINQISQNSINQSNNTNCIGTGIITVIKLLII